MKDYSNYTVADLSVDEYFRSWVLNPTPESKKFWEGLIIQNPSLKLTVNEAIQILTTVQELYHDDLTNEVRENEIKNLFLNNKAAKSKPIMPWTAVAGSWYKIAAVLMVAIGLAGLYYLLARPATVRDNTNEIASVGKDEKMVIEKNESGHARTILLADGSVIVLEHGTTLRYPEKFDGGARSVFLTGDAFFDVARDTTKPFLVYSETTVTKVLGTSFRIKSTSDNVMVAVRTGKVSVQSLSNFKSDSKEPKGGVMLSPNQQVVYNRLERVFEKSLVKNPQKITSDSDKQELGFDETAVSDIFHALEKNYGIRIAFDESRFSQCTLTTQFTDETLRQRLQAICQVTGASFKITEGQVLIEGTCE